MARNSTVRRVCFTLHDYTDTEVDSISTFIKLNCKYGIFGKEVCPTTNRIHLQGFINLIKPTRFNTVKSALCNRAHLENAKGTDIENKNYCEKEGDFFEHGTPSSQGKRSDLEAVVETLKETQGSMATVAELFPGTFIRYHRGIAAYKALVLPPPQRGEKTELRVYCGIPGAGKSRRATEEATQMAEADASKIYYKQRGEWWDGYNQQPYVIIDDFYGWLKFDELLKIADRYPYRVPIKGGFEVFNSKCIWITSNALIKDWYHFPKFDPTALYRRCNSYLFFNGIEVNAITEVSINF